LSKGGNIDIEIAKEQKDNFKYLSNSESLCISSYGVKNLE